MDENFGRIFAEALRFLPGRHEQIRFALLAILCRGNLLIEDLPGLGKTTLVHLLAGLLGRKLTRIQFTNDLLASDIVGAVVYDRDKNDFYFRKGPIFGEVVLADELNRAAPKSQSALLQGMEEKKVSVEGRDYPLGGGFCLIATQNPYDHVGTSPLPESQLDRFFMGMTMGSLSRDYERAIMEALDIREDIAAVGTALGKGEQEEFSLALGRVVASEALLEYALDLMEALRKVEGASGHVSPRAGRDLLTAAKGNALVEGRSFVVPEDLKCVAPAVFSHRLGLYRGIAHGRGLVEGVLAKTAVP